MYIRKKECAAVKPEEGSRRRNVFSVKMTTGGY